MKKLFFTLCLTFLSIGSFAQTVLKSGTYVTLRFIEEVRSSIPTANVVVANDVKVGDQVVINAGTPVLTQVDATQRKGCGRAGTLNVSFISTQATDGTIVNLIGGNIYRQGENKKGLAIGLGVGVGIFLWPGLAFLAIKGEDAIIPAGTMTLYVMTANEISIK